jgi:hypothetical protein
MENVLLWLDIIIGFLTGLSIAIPLVVTLYKTIKNLIQEKKWNELVQMTLGFMTEVEQKYTNGADKKALVLAMIQKSANQIGYNLNAESETKISDLIDSICDAARIINTQIETADKK